MHTNTKKLFEIISYHLLHSTSKMKRNVLTLSEKSDILASLDKGASINEWCTAFTGRDSEMESRHW